ncbi:MAG: T9SS type A sorting domain-containing protein [candidate division Zixibacteria bacterium]|nr:T9SS type A sorting domain-containing protein [candidate division Zixibacteria bacterium]
MKKMLLLVTGIFFAASAFAFAQDVNDPGSPDSIIVSSVEVDYTPGEINYVDVPIYFVTDDSVPSFFLPITWNSIDGGVYPTEVAWNGLLADWEEVGDSIYGDYIRILGFHDITDDVLESPLFTDYSRFEGLTITFAVSAEAQEQICTISNTYISNTFRLYFSLMHGVGDFVPIIVDGSITVGDGVGVDDAAQTSLPNKYALAQNYPNPFNPETKIDYQLPEAGFVKLDIFNILGQRVKTLVDEYKEAGYYQTRWNGFNESGRTVPSGVYFYNMSTEKFSQTKKMLMLK